MSTQKISVATKRLSTTKTTIKRQKSSIHIDHESSKPDWEAEKNVAERPLWQVVALAMNVSPVPAHVATKKQQDSNWEREYNKTVTAMCELLFPARKVGYIFYEPIKPINSVRVGDRAKLKFIRVDVATATTSLIKYIDTAKQPSGFQKMHEHLTKISESSNPLNDSTVGLVPASTRAPKSQEAANETKASNTLKVLLYAIVQDQHGWVDLCDIDKNTTLVKIEKLLEAHQLKSTRSLNQQWIEDAIDHGAKLAPLRPPPIKN